MDKIKIKIITIGHMPLGFDLKRIKRFKSSIFEIDKNIENYKLNCNSDGPGWRFSDDSVRKEIPSNFDSDFVIAIVNVPIQDNYYSRRLGNNKIVFTFYEIKEILEYKNIPIENAILRVLNSYSLVYKSHNNTIPDDIDVRSFTHDETRGCLFDMTGIKTDLVASCHRPIICKDCMQRLSDKKVSYQVIEKTQNEIFKIKKDLYYRILSIVKKHPVGAMLLSGIVALVLGTTGSICGSYIYAYLNSGR